jgi:Acyl-CoA carboxylase epsilon subunit
VTQRENQEDDEQRPFLKVISGNATAEEIAAIVAVLGAMSGDTQEPSKPPTPAWSANHRKARETFRHGRGGWRSSGLPR